MPRTCTICNREDREEIERALLAREAFRSIAVRTGTTKSSLIRHKQDHLPGELAKAHAVEEVLRADSLLTDVRRAEGRAERLYAHAERILDQAQEAKDWRTANQAIRTAVGVMLEAREYLKLRGDLTGELDRQHVAVNLYSEQRVQVLALPKCPGVGRHVPLDVPKLD